MPAGISPNQYQYFTVPMLLGFVLQLEVVLIPVWILLESWYILSKEESPTTSCVLGGNRQW